MNEGAIFNQPPETGQSEPNLALERQDAVDLHNEIAEKYNALPDEDKQFPKERDYKMTPEAEEYSKKMFEARRRVANIDEYRKEAIPDGSQEDFHTGEMTTLEQAQQEKEKVDQEIQKLEKDIKGTKQDFNRLRRELGLAPSEDIPNLIVKNEKLEKLVNLKSNIEEKIGSLSVRKDISEQEIAQEGRRKEGNFLEEFSHAKNDLLKVVDSLKERSQQGYSKIFQDEEELMLSMRQMGQVQTSQEVVDALSRIIDSLEPYSGPREQARDKPESLFELSRRLNQLITTVSDLPKSVGDDNDELISKLKQDVVNRLGSARSTVIGKAQALERYLST